MKTRIVKTKMWSDNRILKLSPLARFTFLFLLTSPYVGMTNYFECADVYIMAGTGIMDVEPIKKELQESGLVSFYEGWVFIPNLEKHNNYKNSPSNKKTYDTEISLIPQANLDFFNTSVDTTVHSSNKIVNKKQEIKNKKQETRNHKKEIENISLEEKEKIAEKYNVPLSFIESKVDDMLNWHEQNPAKNKKTNWVATLRVWVKKDALKIKQDFHGQSKITVIERD